MIPTSRLAALVTGHASAPISCINLGNERQPTDVGAATVFGKAAAHRPVKSNAALALAGI
jgi:hypothetical protein